MCSNDIDIHFETYKLHAELAERVAHIRESLNRLYSGMVVGLVAAMVLVNRLAIGTQAHAPGTQAHAPGTDMTWLFYALGVVIAITWLLSMHSVKGRLKAKHTVFGGLGGQNYHSPFLRPRRRGVQQREVGHEKVVVGDGDAVALINLLRRMAC